MTEVLDYLEEAKKYKIIDSHMHLGTIPDAYYYKYSDERVMGIQREFNVEISLCSHCIGFFNIDKQIDEIKKVSEKFSSSIHWYIIYDPNYPQKSIKILEDNKDKINFAGVKIHPVIHSTRLDSDAYNLLWEYAKENDIVILSHTWSPFTDNPKQQLSNPLLLESVLYKFKNLKVILGHSGGKIDFYGKVIDFARKYKNIYLELSGDTLYPPVFREILDKVGPERALFGTDMPMVDIRYHIINVLLADLDNKEREDIFYNNAKKLFKID